MNKSEQYNATRETILGAANRVLAAKAAEGFTLEAVALEAGVSKGGLLYHFPSKKKLIEGMIALSISRIDAALAEELEQSGGDYLTAYIRASFRTAVEPEQVSRAMMAATANDPELLEPIRARFERIHHEITTLVPSPELGMLIRLCMDGLWYAQMYQFAPPSAELCERLQELLISTVGSSR